MAKTVRGASAAHEVSMYGVLHLAVRGGYHCAKEQENPRRNFANWPCTIG